MDIVETCIRGLKDLGAETNASIEELRSATERLPEREQIEAIARAFNVRVRKVKVPDGPFSPENGMIVAFKTSGQKRVPIAIALGDRMDADRVGLLEPEAYFFLRPLPPRSLSLRELLTHITAGTRRDWIALLALGVAVSGLGMAVPLLTGKIFDRLVPSSRTDLLVLALLAILIISIAMQILDVSAALIRLRLQARLNHSSKASLMDRILALPTHFFRGHAVGGLLARSGIADSEQERRVVSAFTGLFSGVFSASNLVVLLVADLRMGLFSLVVGLGLIAEALWKGSKKIQRERKLIETTVRVRSLLFQIFNGISKVRTAGAERRFFAKWSELFHERLTLNLESSRITNASTALHSFVPLACMAVFFWLTGRGYGSARLSPGQYMAAISAFSLYMGGLARIAGAVADLAVAVPRLERARPILLAPLEQSARGARPGRLSGAIELKNVSFRYSPETPLVLENVGLQIKPGQFVAIVGPSGSGKSTLVRLLLGFDPPENGLILYDGTPLSRLDVFEVRRQIGTVLQHDHLMAGNIYENIAAVRAITHDEAWEAARVAGLDRDLENMPMGLHSFVTPGARAFSGGERQRMMIARAVAGRPSILLLDEATSSLDNRVQCEVIRNLERLNVTRIIVAHRLSTVQNADLIVVLDRGRIAEAGTYADLIATNGLFARLARRQTV